MNLAQRVTELCFGLMIGYWPFFIILMLLMVVASHFRVNRETDDVDLMSRYMWLEMRRRYVKTQI